MIQVGRIHEIFETLDMSPLSTNSYHILRKDDMSCAHLLTWNSYCDVVIAMPLKDVRYILMSPAQLELLEEGSTCQGNSQK